MSDSFTNAECAEKLVLGLAQAQTALRHFDENRNPVHLMHDTNCHTIGLIIQGRDNCEAAVPLLDQVCAFLQKRGQWLDQQNGGK